MAEELIMYGTTWCPDCYRAKSFLNSRNVPFKWIDIANDPVATAEVERMNKGNRSVPTIVFPDGSVLVEPSNSELEKKLSPRV